MLLYFTFVKVLELKDGEVDEYLDLGFPAQVPQGVVGQVGSWIEVVCCYKVGYLENVMEREEVSSIFLLMFLYLAFKGRSREHSSVQADWVQKFGQGFEIFHPLRRDQSIIGESDVALEHWISIL